MNTLPECDICSLKFTIPTVKASIQMNCPHCDFQLFYDGEFHNKITAKSLSTLIDGIQYYFDADLIDNILKIEIEECKSEPAIEGIVLAEIPLTEYSSIKLDYDFAKQMVKLLKSQSS